MLVGAFAPQGALALGDTSTTASGCSIAAGRDATSNTITCNYGLTPEQVQELTKAAVSGAVGPLRETIVELSKRLGVTEDATQTMLRILGDQDVPLERLSQKLTEIANQYQKLQAQAAQASALNLDNSQARSLVEQAQGAIKAGDFGKAHQLLREAREAQIAAAEKARKLRRQARAAEDAELIGAAAATATEGDVAMTELQYEQAADLFKEAAALVPPGHPAETANYLHRRADALYREGDERGDNASLEQSIEVWHEILQYRPRKRVPLDWAMTQNNLGNSLTALGARETGTARLEEAVAAFHAALEEQTREKAPVQWAMDQNNLGNALTALGARETGTARLEHAVTAFRAALHGKAGLSNRPLGAAPVPA
jgi:tetratricopeptide (TPR) repeat protein